MSKKTGGQAFPHVKDRAVNYGNGMTLRDYFAGQALVAMGDRRWKGDEQETATQKHARACYIMADALLAEREKSND